MSMDTRAEMTKKLNIVFVVNKHAGAGRAEIAAKKAIAKLAASGHEARYMVTNYVGHATEIAAQAAMEGADVVVAAGGDGTVNESAKGILGTKTALAILPFGSGNGLARELRVPANIEKATKIISNGHPSLIDVCMMGDQHFVCTCGLGFDALVAHKMAKVKTRGFLQYAKITIIESLGYKPFAIKLKVDGQLISTNALMVTIANASQFGNNAFIAPKAKVNDGSLDLVIVSSFPKVFLPILSIAIFTKLIHKLPYVQYIKAKQIDILASGTNYTHFDGEPGITNAPFTVTINNQKLMVKAGAPL